MLFISGIQMPTPSSFSVGISDNVETTKNAKGDLIAERLSSKRYIDFGYTYLTSEQISTLFRVFEDNFFVTVVYPDPSTNNERTGTFYCSSRTAPSLDWIDENNIKYKDIRISLKER